MTTQTHPVCGTYLLTGLPEVEEIKTGRIQSCKP